MAMNTGFVRPMLLGAAMLLWNTSTASADRAPLPTTSVCNKSKTTVYVATATVDTYTGWHHNGWVLVEPKSCKDFRDDAFHLRGKRNAHGLSKRTLPGCVSKKGDFSLIMGHWEGAQSRKKCLTKKGRVVRFTYPNAGPKPRIDVTK